MNIEDLSRRLLVGISLEIELGNTSPYIRDLASRANISETHTRRLLKILLAHGFITRQRSFRRCHTELSEAGRLEVKELREYFRLS